VAVLYRAMMRAHSTPITVVNEMELWEVAVAFGLDEDRKPRLVSKGERAPARLEDLSEAEQARINRFREHKRMVAEDESPPI